MSRSRIAALAALALAAACSDGQNVVAPPADAVVSPSFNRGPEEVMPGEVLVKYKPGMSPLAVRSAHGLRLERSGYANAFEVLQTAEGNERAAAQALAADPRVEWAEPNYLRQPTAINPNLWAFFNPGGLNMKYSSGKNNGQFLPASYASTLDADEDNIAGYAAGGGDVVVGSIDTGVDMTHVEFTGRLIAGKDWYNNDNDPTDDDGHGSHTTGTMAGTTVGIAGVSGASPHVRVYVQKVCGRRGCPTSAIVSAIRAAADYPGMVAMNMSLGGSSESQAEADAIAYATSKNVLVIASAGNAGTGTVECPACDPNSISVSATTWADKLAPYSSFGPGLDISAPGGSCYSNTTPEGCIYSAFKGGGYAWEQGTSMAAPQVTGTAAVVASVTGLRGSALRSRILSTADDLGTAGADNTFGA
ncbi:MAG TPA: S8 family serine peptidase, partial [Longimicrobiaceae bacterium]|nr:S8 family serine peptidase [Longimicrobiaceae bacterium]